MQVHAADVMSKDVPRTIKSAAACLAALHMQRNHNMTAAAAIVNSCCACLQDQGWCLGLVACENGWGEWCVCVYLCVSVSRSMRK